ncbi:class I adenylate-forming enzyme family protein [Cupriavidus taiwanensis]|uniref:class I adenylate-forming enzyme family protein n=1 Tax=Cupriavidus taiwanensis TaxID=164546 RepID=UPI000E2EAF76|nr:class I adenylate-forming enzyme family protein [Cupriavidus taiwanensis]
MQNILTLHDPQRARDYYLSGVWQDQTLYSLARRHAQERPTAWALRDDDIRLTWREVVDWADSVGHSLRERGLRAGDRVGIWLPNVVQATIVFLACSRNGYVCCPSLHQNYTVDEICTLLNRIQCRALFTMPGYGADSDRHSIFARAADIPTLAAMFAMPGQASGDLSPPAPAHPFPDRLPPAALSAPEANPDKIVYLAFTSGTTGLPKGVMHSDNTLLANGRALVHDWKQRADTTLLTLSPMSHHIGTVALEQVLVSGAELVMSNLRGSKQALESILETGATYVMGVPTHAMDILQAMREGNILSLGQVRTFYMAGSAIPREVAQQFMDLGVMPQNVYGMTENGSHNYTIPTDSADTIVSTCGRACRGYEIRLWKQDKPNEEAGCGEIGEIGGRGGLLMLGYFGNQTATETSFNAHGWFMSGDLGKFDSNGCIEIVGRKKDLIIRGGHNIHPARVEELAMRHPMVERAAAYPVPDERLGERVCLSIVVRDGHAIEGQDMLTHLAECGLSKYDMPEFLLTMDAFPLTPSGKILKRDLVEMTKRGELKPVPVRYKAGATAGA